MGLLAYRTYSADPPIAERAVDPEGNTVYTGDDVSEGQTIFLSNGLMQYGSIFGHGAYLGPDYTADYLRRSALIVEEGYREDGMSDPGQKRSPTSGRTATTRIRHARVDRGAGRSPSRSFKPTTPSSSASPRRRTAFAPMRSPTPRRSRS